jgi:hypothetical protein
VDASQVKVRLEVPIPETARPDGAVGGRLGGSGVTVWADDTADVFDPAVFAATTWKSYVVPDRRPVTMTERPVMGEPKLVQVTVPLVRYWA